MEKNEKTFDEVYKLNVNKLTEKKNGLTYLTWAHAWKLFKEIYPTATYEVQKFHSGRPYVDDENFGIMCFTTVSVGSTTHEMWLPVMDGANKSMKFEAYDYTTRAGTRTVAGATMFDINKTIMRCLTKNLAMFGLGLYIYAGEDLPSLEEPLKPSVPKKAKLNATQFKKALDSILKKNYTVAELIETFDLTESQLEQTKTLK